MNTELLKQELILDEGQRHSVYQDSRGYWTIGVGHCVDQRLGCGISDNIIQELLNEDIQTKIVLCESHLWWKALDTDARQRAVLNMVFNLGLGGFMSLSTFIQLLSEKRWAEAALDLTNTLWYKQVGARAVRIVSMIENG